MLARRPRWARNDFWAPELVRRDGRFLAYYAALGRNGRRCVAGASAGRIAGPYRDHGRSCAAAPARSTRSGDGRAGRRAGSLWKRDGNSRERPTPILAAPLAPGGMSLAAPPRELFRAGATWERDNVEAPALLRHGGFVYLFYSAGHCCGRNCTYATGVARAQTLMGAWEKRRRPILRGGGPIRCPGHVGVTSARDGAPLLAYHAYVRGDPSNRQLFMTRLRFGVAGGRPSTRRWPATAARPRSPAGNGRPARGPISPQRARNWCSERARLLARPAPRGSARTRCSTSPPGRPGRALP